MNNNDAAQIFDYNSISNAVALPMPIPAPVTMATLFSKVFIRLIVLKLSLNKYERLISCNQFQVSSETPSIAATVNAPPQPHIVLLLQVYQCLYLSAF